MVNSSIHSSGKIFGYEAIGDAMDGLAITLILIPWFHAIQIALLLVTLNFVSALVLVFLFNRRYYTLSESKRRFFNRNGFKLLIVGKVDYVELDPLIIEAVKRFQTPLTELELRDPRVLIKYTDGRLFVSQSQRSYDVIIVNLPSPSTILLNRF